MARQPFAGKAVQVAGGAVHARIAAVGVGARGTQGTGATGAGAHARCSVTDPIERIEAALAKLDPSGLTLEQEEIYDACLKIEAKLVQQWFGEEIEPAKAAREMRF